MPTVSTSASAFPKVPVLLPEDLRGLRVHLIGVAGSGMSGLAAFLLRRGAAVSGSDARAAPELSRLAAAGAMVTTDQSGRVMPAELDLVVRSAAISDDHPEVVAAQQRGVPVIKYAQMLGLLMARCEGIAISGTHGKSTTTALLTYILKKGGYDPSFVVGANVPQLGGSSGAGDGRFFVAEACEYDRSFFNLRPRRAAILNIEKDHLDCYPSLQVITEAFTQFALGLPAGGVLVVNAQDPCCRQVAAAVAARVETFGLSDHADWHARDLEIESGCYTASFCWRDQVFGRIRLGIPGKHNVENALAAIALARDCGLKWQEIAAGLTEFRGASRRLELRGQAGGVRVLDDYAHHPTEIRVTLAAARERYEPNRLWVIFQPHQHSRTRFLLSEFAESFSLADYVVVPDIYFVRDSERDREAVCAADLVERLRARGCQADYIPSFSAIAERVAAAVRPGDAVLTMGAGDIWMVADELLRRLGGNLSG